MKFDFCHLFLLDLPASVMKDSCDSPLISEYTCISVDDEQFYFPNKLQVVLTLQWWVCKMEGQGWKRGLGYAAFRLACRLLHCCFDGDFCTTAQAPLAAEGWPSGKQRHANRSITLPLCPPRQITDSWILFNSGAMPLGDKAKAAWPLRAATLKQQAMITRCSGKAATAS